MRVSHAKSLLVNCAFLGSIAFGSIGTAKQAGAQTVYTPASNQPVAVTVPPTQEANSTADVKLAARVKNALHSDPYFNDEHVTVSVENGVVVLRGFVSSEWDLHDAIRIASRASGDKLVVDNLSMKLGGGR